LLPVATATTRALRGGSMFAGSSRPTVHISIASTVHTSHPACLGKHDVVGWLSAVRCGGCGKTRRRRYRVHQERDFPQRIHGACPCIRPAAIRRLSRLSRVPAFSSYRRLPQADRFSSTSAFRNRTTRVEPCRRSPPRRRARPHSAPSKRDSTRFGLARCGEP